MSLLLVAPDRNLSAWKDAIHKIDPHLNLDIWPNINWQRSGAICSMLESAATFPAGYLPGCIQGRATTKNYPFWNRSSIVITPYVSSITRPQASAEQIVENYKRVLSGLPQKIR